MYVIWPPVNCDGALRARERHIFYVKSKKLAAPYAKLDQQPDNEIVPETDIGLERVFWMIRLKDFQQPLDHLCFKPLSMSDIVAVGRRDRSDVLANPVKAFPAHLVVYQPALGPLLELGQVIGTGELYERPDIVKSLPLLAGLNCPLSRRLPPVYQSDNVRATLLKFGKYIRKVSATECNQIDDFIQGKEYSPLRRSSTSISRRSAQR
ncbi:hypothetical protein BSY240_591 [Agrobacterium sp. RAC06]|nr:hypothetical protein BSY240_591 [Agrobacterium sp. RAC06]